MCVISLWRDTDGAEFCPTSFCRRPGRVAAAVEGFEVDAINAEGGDAAPLHVLTLHHETLRLAFSGDPDPQGAIGFGRLVHGDAETHRDQAVGGETELFGKGEAVAVVALLILVIDVGLAAAIGAPHETRGKTVGAIGAAATAD